MECWDGLCVQTCLPYSNIKPVLTVFRYGMVMFFVLFCFILKPYDEIRGINQLLCQNYSDRSSQTKFCIRMKTLFFLVVFVRLYAQIGRMRNFYFFQDSQDHKMKQEPIL